jgi:hypothetical protein
MTKKFTIPPGAVEGLYLDPAVEGWYTDPTFIPELKYDFNDSVTEDLNLYANWTEPILIPLSGADNTLKKALTYIKATPLAVPTNYTILLDGDCSLASGGPAYITTANAVITLVGKVPSKVSLSSNGRLFWISAGKLILDNNITLKGFTGNTASLVQVAGTSSALTMEAGAKITGNTSGYGGGVNVDQGSFTMNGGEISDNSVTGNGGGVYVGSGGGSFTMNGGEIFDNFATGTSSTDGYGGGVCVSSSFTMNGGKIFDNSSTYGGGVFGSFTMNDGEISDNLAAKGGGGVSSNSISIMSGGIISGNSVVYSGSSFGFVYGGGVYIQNGSFTMEGGEISGNTASSDVISVTDGGGGVYVSTGSFTMEDGKISGNTSGYGGGVYVAGNGSFSKTGNSVIYGDMDGNPDNGNTTDNTAKKGNTNGHAVYYYKDYSSVYYRDDTLDEEDDISTSDTLPGTWGQTLNNWTKK